MLVAASVSVGNAIAETEVPDVPAPPAPTVAEPAAPAAPAVPEVSVAQVPEPAAPAAPAPDVEIPAPSEPVVAAPPAADASTDASATAEAAVESDATPVESMSTATMDVEREAAAATAPISERTHQPNHRDPCEGAPSGSYPRGNQCVIDICHATGSETNPFVAITVDADGYNGHGDHPHDIIPAPSGGCPARMHDECPSVPGNQPPGTDCTPGTECTPPAFPQGNTCKVNICHATGSATNPYVFITVNENGLEGHGDHPGDIIPAPTTGCPDVIDACPGPLNPGNQPPGTTCIVDACPGPLNPGNQPAGTVCITDACPDELNPGDQPFGFPCVGDACPGLLNPGNQPAGTVCIVDACPDALNPGNQPIGTVCIVDACPDQLNPGNQPFGTVCAVPVPPPAPAATPTPTPTETPAPILPPEPSVPVEEPSIATPVAEDEVLPVLGVEDEPDQAEPAAAAAPSGELPFTGARTFGLTVFGLLAFLAGATLVRRRPHRAK